MKISNPTNDQIVEMIAYNRRHEQATNISYRGFEVWVYTHNVVEVDYPNGTIEVSLDALIEIMSNNQAELVE